MNRTILQLGTMAIAVAFSTMAFAAGVAVEEPTVTTGKLFDLSKDPAKVLNSEVAPTAKSNGMSFNKSIPGQGNGLQLPSRAAIPSNITTNQINSGTQCDKDSAAPAISAKVHGAMSVTEIERVGKNLQNGACGKKVVALQEGPLLNALKMADDIDNCLGGGNPLADTDKTSYCDWQADQHVLGNDEKEAQSNELALLDVENGGCAFFAGVTKAGLQKISVH
jgi:hypothetical protein